MAAILPAEPAFSSTRTLPAIVVLVVQLAVIPAAALTPASSKDADLTEQHTLSKPPEDARMGALLREAAESLALGRVNAARSGLLQAEALARARGDTRILALVHGQISDADVLERRLPEALAQAKTAVRLAGETGDQVVRATALNHLGNARLAAGDPSAALSAYTEAIGLARAAGKRILQLRLSLNAVRAQLSMGELTGAETTLGNAFDLLDQRPDAGASAYDLLTAGVLAQELLQAGITNDGRWRRLAYRALSRAEALSETSADDRTRSYSLGHLGELYADAGRIAEAQQLYRRALFYASQSEAPELAARWQWRLAGVLRAQGEDDLAMNAYREALKNLERIQTALIYGRRGAPESFRSTTGRVYLDLADLLLGRARDAASASERRDALEQVRGVMEELKAVELKDYFRDQCVTEQRARLGITQLDGLLEPGTAALYPILFPDRVVLLLSLPDGGLEEIVVPADAQTVRETARAFRRELSHAGNPRRLRRQGLTLYHWLIRPIEPQLREAAISTLVIVPDEALLTIPFAALYDGRAFLVRRFNFVVSPGLLLTDPGTSPDRPQRALLSGLSQSVQQFSELPYVPDEIRRVSALYDHTTLLDSDFKKARLTERLRDAPYSVVLFATHAQFNNDPRRSFILTHDGRISFAELDRFVRIAQFREHPVDLLVLSGCETAEGDERAALGLAGAAVKAGARSVLASLWQVNDASTAELVSVFFERLQDRGTTKAQALALAQQQVLDDPGSRHPFYWAPFVLIGAWR